MENAARVIVPGCWLVFVGYWLVSALKVKRAAERQSLGSALAHRIPVGLGWWFMLADLYPALHRRVLPHTDMVIAIGTLICILGLGVTLWARWTLAGNWSSDVTFKQHHELVRRGPYRFVRHPIYTGLLVMGMGTAIESGRLGCWVGLVSVTVGFWIKLCQEERLLLRHFPQDYPAYRKEVKALVPWLL